MREGQGWGVSEMGRRTHQIPHVSSRLAYASTRGRVRICAHGLSDWLFQGWCMLVERAGVLYWGRLQTSKKKMVQCVIQETTEGDKCPLIDSCLHSLQVVQSEERGNYTFMPVIGRYRMSPTTLKEATQEQLITHTHSHSLTQTLSHTRSHTNSCI